MEFQRGVLHFPPRRAGMAICDAYQSLLPVSIYFAPIIVRHVATTADLNASRLAIELALGTVDRPISRGTDVPAPRVPERL